MSGPSLSRAFMDVRIPPRLLYRLFKIRLLSGVILALPLALCVAWYGWSAFAQIDRYRRSAKGAPPIDAELFQIALHDELTSDWHRLFLPERRADSPMRTFELSLTRESLEALSATAKKKEG